MILRAVRIIVLTLAAALGVVSNNASCHDLPPSAHPATMEAVAVEDLLASQAPGTESNFQLFSFVAKKLLWPPSTILYVCFWNGTDARRARVAALANNVAALTPVRFAWGPNGSFQTCPSFDYGVYQVRVSLEPDSGLLAPGDSQSDYFASVGRLNLNAPRKATVNLPFPANADDAVVAEKTLHEFCHVLGCLHEHQRGLCDNDFNKSWIENRYQLNDAQYEANFLKIPSSDVTYGAQTFGSFDDKSIMLYSIPKEAFSNLSSPCFRAAPVADLSPKDENGLRQSYALTPDPRLAGVNDFNRLASAADDLARQKRGEAAALRTSVTQWAMTTPLLEGSERPQAANTLETLAVQADAAADKARAEADSFRLTPVAQQRLAAFLAALPPGN